MAFLDWLLGGPDVQSLKRRRDIPGLVQALGHKSEKIRENAVSALGELHDPQTIEPICAALKDASWSVRMRAAEALGDVGDRRGVEPLIATLKDSEWSVRRMAAEALGKIGDARAVEPLIAALADDEGSTFGPRTMLWAAARHSPEAAEAVSKEIESGSFQDRKITVGTEAAIALEKIGTPEALHALYKFRARKM